MKKHNLLIVHGGAPTAVINASLYGVLKEAAPVSYTHLTLPTKLEV